MLFNRGSFQSHSGLELTWKIECDSLPDSDLEALAELVGKKLKFDRVIGVPRGGLRFAQALRPYSVAGGPTLLVDDVLTTGRSMTELRGTIDGPVIGVVIFARGSVPLWVTPIFELARQLCP